MKLAGIPLWVERFFLSPPKPRHIHKTLGYMLVSDKLEFISGKHNSIETFLTDRKVISQRNKELHYQHNNHNSLIKALERDERYYFLLQNCVDPYVDFLKGTLSKSELIQVLDAAYQTQRKNAVQGKSAETQMQLSQHAFVLYYHYLSIYEGEAFPKLELANIKEVVSSRLYKQYIGSVRYEGVKKHFQNPFPTDRKNIAYTLKALNEAISIAHRERNERVADALIRKLSKVHATYLDVRGITEDDIAS